MSWKFYEIGARPLSIVKNGKFPESLPANNSLAQESIFASRSRLTAVSDITGE
jgi:hypothetical protein